LSFALRNAELESTRNCLNNKLQAVVNTKEKHAEKFTDSACQRFGDS